MSVSILSMNFELKIYRIFSFVKQYPRVDVQRERLKIIAVYLN